MLEINKEVLEKMFEKYRKGMKTGEAREISDHADKDFGIFFYPILKHLEKCLGWKWKGITSGGGRKMMLEKMEKHLLFTVTREIRDIDAHIDHWKGLMVYREDIFYTEWTILFNIHDTAWGFELALYEMKTS